MEMKIKRLKLENFKGVKDAEYTFSDFTNVFGKNGVGKTTIATAFYWLFFDKSYDLASNPAVKPLDATECTVRVEMDCEINGKEIALAKIQKNKEKEQKDGTIKRTSTNSYEVNSVEKTERDFKASLVELGFDFEKALFLSHPTVFTAGMNEKKAREQMRAMLFSMCSDLSDKEVAEKSSLKEVSALLDSYKLEEIESMQNSTIRKIREVYGKEGELLRAKIEGLESAKVDVNEAELELQRNEIKERLEKLESEMNGDNSLRASLSSSVIEMKAKQNEIVQELNKGYVEEKNRLSVKQSELSMDKAVILNKLDHCTNETVRNKNLIERYKTEMADKENKITELRKKIKVAQERVFDETQNVCPYCGQEYPESKKVELLKDFEARKYAECESIAKDGHNLKNEIKGIQDSINNLEKQNSENLIQRTESEKKFKVVETELADVENKIAGLKPADPMQDEQYAALENKIKEVETELSKPTDNSHISEQITAAREELALVERKIAQAYNNVNIDEQISELLAKQKEFEQSRANAEKIIEQIKELNKAKNELKASEINAHFKIVNFKLFDYLKNGEYKDVCIPMIDGKQFEESTNTGREILAKLDIINGLQEFYGQRLPVFLDNAESLSEETKKRIECEHQMIFLNVSEDENLRFENEGR